MIGGIYCQCKVPTIPNPRTVESVNWRAQTVFGNTFFNENEWKNIFIDTLLQTAYKSLSKYVLTKRMRDYLHDTTDLAKSMGVAVYWQGTLVAQKKFSAEGAQREQEDRSKTVLKGGVNSSGESWRKNAKEREHPDPGDRFKDFVKMMPRFYRVGYSVAFVATMPYATRLEFNRVSDDNQGGIPSGGYEKRVLIGNINSIVNNFYREFYPAAKKIITYGYVFESTGRHQNIASDVSNVNSTTSTGSRTAVKQK